ncbi:TATE DNA transposon [Leptomonas pyrrhocoris]|uniref:TATE DNA transposon n=1 Tax=Leptomonas pyrrhocoris TaxID=157538 RepID=A0A0M9FNX8_LEPPY|nr:TATE DNA transposon [Leptomonas pyrrhocoris]KPA73100.1 TATE DNA transposon [Leptomonas pyrrhocoris]|eukprot:XP_015651539.1 TATE DNA transposon [Leptomonas pyrrhocoris]
MPPTRVYRLTQHAGQSVVGLYARQTEQTADEAVAAAADRDTRPRPVASTAPAPVDAPQPTGSQEQEARQEAPPPQSNVTAADEEDEDRREALQVEPEPLNWQGRRNEAVICPREWILYSSRPRHVSQLTWAAVTPTIRQQHIRWLRELKTMPSDLLQLDLATAALTLVNRMHRARRWKWSTHTKALSNIRAALFNLPLYSNVQKRVDLTEYPQWTAAITAAHRFERETPSNPPPPIDIGQYRQAREHLRLHPIPSLYLGMMWAFAARAGDIGQLKARDVHFNPTTNEAEPTIRVSLTVRRGKGARFRGPYTLASRLLRADASVLQQLLATRGPGQLLFSPLGPLKDTVRAALRLFNPSAALPSVRKGAARCLADNAATDTEVMRLTGHTRVATLQRYLDYGRHLTAEAVTAQDNAARALLVPNTSA